MPKLQKTRYCTFSTLIHPNRSNIRIAEIVVKNPIEKAIMVIIKVARFINKKERNYCFILNRESPIWGNYNVNGKGMARKGILHFYVELKIKKDHQFPNNPFDLVNFSSAVL